MTPKIQFSHSPRPDKPLELKFSTNPPALGVCRVEGGFRKLDFGGHNLTHHKSRGRFRIQPISALMFPRITAWWADVIDEPDYESEYPALPSWADPPASDDEYDHLGRNVSAQLRRQSLVPWKLVVRGKDYEL